MWNWVEDVGDQGRQLVRLRWVAVGGISAVTAVSSWLGLIDTGIPILVVAGIIAVYNLALWRAAGRVGARASVARRLLGCQFGMDLIALTALLHFAGGIENPFVAYYVFLVMLGGLICSKREGYALAAGAFVLFAATALLEYAGWLQHHHLRIPPHSPGLWKNETYLLGTLLALGSTLAVTIVFTSVVMERLRSSLEAQLALREKLGQQERLALIGEVVAGVVHELASPLDGVRNSFRILRRDPKGFLEREGLMELMEEALDRMASISKRLLTLARAPEIDRRPVSISEVVERAVTDLRHRVDAGGVPLECRLAEDLPPVQADRIALTEVMANLLANALDAVEGVGEVKVETSNSQGGVEIRVIDTGPGIPAAARSRLFEPFHSTKPVGRGTGLGLAISKRLVEAHGGSIAVESRVGEGTTVTVRLPIGEGEGS
jgi:signal transduction histidine kinase